MHEKMESLPLSKLKKRLDAQGLRILKYRYEIPRMPFRKVLELIEEPALREQYLNFYDNHPRFAETPGGAKHHHWWKGGLEDHVKEMIGLGLDILEMYPGDWGGRVRRSDIIICCFLHDFAKIALYRYISREEKEKAPNKFLPNQVFTVKQGSFDIVDEESWTLLELGKWGITPTEKQWSGVLFAEGGYSDANFGYAGARTPTGDNVNAKNSLAVLMHILDTYSAHILGKSLVARRPANAEGQDTGVGGPAPGTGDPRQWPIQEPGGEGLPAEVGPLTAEDIRLPAGAEGPRGAEHGGDHRASPGQDEAT